MSLSPEVVATSPLILTFGSALLSVFIDLEKKWQTFVLTILGALFILFTYFFFFPMVETVLPHSLIDIRFNKISLFVGMILCGSLFAGIFPVRKEIVISPRFLLLLAGGLGIILANNLPTFFFFWTLQRSIPLVGFLRDIKRSGSTGGATYVFQHFLGFLCLSVLSYLAWEGGLLAAPLSEYPLSFLTWPVLLLSSVIIYQSHGVFPFHSWVHDIVGHLPWYEISCLFLPRAGVLFFVQLLLPTLTQEPDSFKVLLLTLSIVSSIYWSFRGLFEENVSKVTTYFYVAQASLILAGLQADLSATRGSYLHMMVISISGTALWSILSYIQHGFSFKRPSQFYGLAQYYPKLATLFCLFGLCMIGVPLGASFVVEDLVITGLLHYQPYLGLGHIVATSLNGMLFFLLFSKIFLGPTPYQIEVKVLDMTLWQMVPYILALLLMILIGIMPYLFLEKITW